MHNNVLILGIVIHNMMKTPAPEFNDEVYEMAMAEIHQIFDDVTIEQLKSFSYEYMPSDLKCALDKAQARYDSKNRIYPVSSSTDSQDGKTCDWCKATLVEKTSTVSSSAGVHQKKVMACPNGGLKCKINVQNNNTDSMLEESRKKMEGMTDIFTLTTRHMDIAEAKKVFMNNKDEFLVSSPNNQFTELNFGLKEIFSQDMAKGESKTTKTVELCEHDLERYINIEDGTIDATEMDVKNGEKEGSKTASKYYRLISVKVIGKIGVRNYYDCNVCRNASEIACENWQEDKLREKAKDIIKNTKSYIVEYQRIDSEMEKAIINVLRENRLRGGTLFFKADQIHNAVIRNEYVWLVGRTDKQFVVSRCNKLAKEGVLELEQRNWHFGFTVEGVTHSYDNYLNKANTLNHYRWFNEHAVFLTGQMRKEIDKLVDDRNAYGRSKENTENQHLFFAKLATQFGVSPNELSIGVGDRQVLLLCKLSEIPKHARTNVL